MELDDLRYSAEHMWVRIEDDDRAATVGLTEEMFEGNDDINRLRLPIEGADLVKDQTFGRLTTDKPAVLRLYAPLSGQVTEINEDLLEAPEMILEDPYEEGWLIRLDILNIAEYDDLMTRDEYEDFIGGEDFLEDEDELDEEDIEDDDY